ncbi:tetratricopeptide repeat protein, putative [Pediculus humanus corporis]|uniref:Tetratricopeptide repeat protein, putative n=1 Tax=Pediculus humanus subsp. corporis TaxID=121224 RepID=E0VHW1_PEDHC|nr:tetratricopeptide repeat protein, putative [Pediculus humanus corporis]EEB12967.1 tetratricopeptide repeat protein, putative [Pediculus humanus corporis]
MSKKLSTLAESVEALYNFRDQYFENHSVSDAFNKTGDVKKLLEETLLKFEENKDVEPKERAQYFYLKGKALNVTPNYDPKAEEALSRALKLDIKLYEAWNELGESYWKKENISEAKNCFQGALKQCKNKKSLRNLSMVMRMQKPIKYEDRIKNIEDGVKFAKEAVELDPTDGTSWSVLGNAYLSSFFNLAQYPSVLNLCKSAYAQAEKDIVAKSNPDLYYNKAIVAKYEEDYLSALNSFSQASKLEPSWQEPKLKKSQLLNYLSKVNELYKDKGRIRVKKLSKMLSNMNPDKNLGPYKGGKYKAKNSQEIKLTHCNFNDLKEGLNEEKVVLGVVVCSIQDEDNVPFTFIMVDKNESTIVVTVYNLAQEKGVLIGDYVAVPEPYLTLIHIPFEDKDYSFKSIRIVSPLVMVVNGKKLDKSKQSGLQFSTFTLAD